MAVETQTLGSGAPSPAAPASPASPTPEPVVLVVEADTPHARA